MAVLGLAERDLVVEFSIAQALSVCFHDLVDEVISGLLHELLLLGAEERLLLACLVGLAVLVFLLCFLLSWLFH